MVSAVSFSEAGGHPDNEDAFVISQHPLDPAAWFCCVADGQGGRAGGGRAAKLACETAAGLVRGQSPAGLIDPRFWLTLLRTVDEAVERDPAAGFTTFVGLAVIRGRVVGVSHGDSAAVIATAEELHKLTFGQHKNPPVGSGSATPVPFQTVPVPPWKLLAVTDGVWKYVGWLRLADAARRFAGAALIDELQRAARLPGSGGLQDDFTVVLLEQTVEPTRDIGASEALTPEEQI